MKTIVSKNAHTLLSTLSLMLNRKVGGVVCVRNSSAAIHNKPCGNGTASCVIGPCTSAVRKPVPLFSTLGLQCNCKTTGKVLVDGLLDMSMYCIMSDRSSVKCGFVTIFFVYQNHIKQHLGRWMVSNFFFFFFSAVLMLCIPESGQGSVVFLIC